MGRAKMKKALVFIWRLIGITLGLIVLFVLAVFIFSGLYSLISNLF